MKEEAREVIRAVGAWVLVFRKAINEGGGEGEVVRKHFLLYLCGQEGGGDKGKMQIRAKSFSSISLAWNKS